MLKKAHTFWLVICKLIRVRIRTQLIMLMRIRIRLQSSNLKWIWICNTALHTVEWNLRKHSTVPGCRVASDQVGKMVMHSQSRGRQVICHTQQQVLGRKETELNVHPNRPGGGGRGGGGSSSLRVSISSVSDPESTIPNPDPAF